MARARTDLVIPARNAERELATAVDRAVLRELRSLVVIDRASSDGTAGAARDLGAVVLREPSGGYGAACLRALEHFTAQPEPPEIVAFAPPEARLDRAQFERLLAPILSGDAELTVATIADHRLRDRAVGRLIDTVYGQRFAHPGPIRAIRYPALVALGMSDRGAGWDVEMLVRALRLGVGIVEVDLGGAVSLHRTGGVRATCAATGRTLFHILRHATVR